MGYCLAEHVTFCIPLEKPVFLDAGRDRYYRLGPEPERAFLSLLKGETPLENDLRRLLRLGLIVECDGADNILSHTLHPLPSCSLIENDQKGRSFGTAVLVEVAWTLAIVALRQKLQPFKMVIDGVCRRKH